MSYANRLYKLGIKSLEYRRLEFDIILMFKIYHNLSDLQFDHYFTHSNKKYDLRSLEFTIQSKFRAHSDQFHNFFFIRIVKIWNSLPLHLTSAPNIIIFKKRLRTFDLHSIVTLIF